MQNFETRSTVENPVSNWETLKQEAPTQAEELMSGLNLDTLSPTEQIAALEELLQQLELDNKNRFVYNIISLHMNMIMREQQHQTTMTQLKEAMAE